MKINLKKQKELFARKKILKEEKTISKTGIGTVNIDDIDYAVGLGWETLNTKKSLFDLGATKEAMSRAQKEKADFYCLDKQSRMFGCGYKSKGHQKNMSVLASILAQKLPNPSIGLFVVSVGGVEGYYVFAANEFGHILIDEAFSHERKEEAQKLFNDFLGKDEWHIIFIPTELKSAYTKTTEQILEAGKEGKLDEKTSFLDNETFTDETITQVLKKIFAISSISVPLKPSSNKEVIRNVGLSSLFVIASYIGYSYYSEYQAEQKRIEEAKQKKEFEDNAKNNIIPTQQVNKPWNNKPYATSFIQECHATYNVMKQVKIPGWNLLTYKCNDEIATASFAKTYGSINWIKSMIDKEFPGATVIGKDTTSKMVDVSVKLKVNLMNNSIVSYKSNEVLKFIISQYDELKFTPVFSQSNYSTDYNKLTVETVIKDPTMLIPIYDKLYGSYVQKMEINQNEIWTITVDNYEQAQNSGANGTGKRKGSK